MSCDKRQNWYAKKPGRTFCAYNLVRTIMAQAAYTCDVEPRTISFKGTLQTLEAFRPLIALRGHHGKQNRAELYKALLDSIVLHIVADRPDRFEPRMKKRSHIRVTWMTKPRSELKRLMRQGVTKI